MNNINQKLTKLKHSIAKAAEHFDISKKQEKIKKMRKETQKKGFWENPRKAKEITQKLSDLKEEVEKWQNLKSEVSDLIELSEELKQDHIEKEYQRLREKFQKLELEIYLSGKYDNKNAILSIYAGAGGVDAQDWAKMLERMYTRYAENKGWEVKKITESFGEEGGLKNATLKITDSKVYGWLKKEQGTHRLIRISPFSAQGLRHTSFALVEVLPVMETPEIEIDKKDLKIDTYRASGPGGQHVNRRETAVRITHLPTGLVAASQAERSQARNRKQALKILASKLQAHKEKLAQKKKDALKTKAEPEWGNQIRTYVLHPYKQVRDHRTGVEVSDPEAVLDGDLEPFIQKEIKINTNHH